MLSARDQRACHCYLRLFLDDDHQSQIAEMPGAQIAVEIVLSRMETT